MSAHVFLCYISFSRGSPNGVVSGVHGDPRPVAWAPGGMASPSAGAVRARLPTATAGKTLPPSPACQVEPGTIIDSQSTRVIVLACPTHATLHGCLCMSGKTKKFEKQLSDLISRGIRLSMAIKHEYFRENVERQIIDEFGEDKLGEHIGNLPDFKEQYQLWYSEALSLVKQVLPDRLDDFTSYYKYSRVREPLIYQGFPWHRDVPPFSASVSH